jgi:phospholipase/carboxylesterase
VTRAPPNREAEGREIEFLLTGLPMSLMHTSTISCRPFAGLMADAEPAAPAAPARVLLPDRYTDRYAYPLVVLFHPAGMDEETILTSVPHLSRQNFVVLSLRGPKATEGAGYGWNGADEDEGVEDYFLKAVAQTRRTFHVHSERIYLVGLGEGTLPAYRLALANPDRVAGVAALNGPFPKPKGNPLFRLETVRGLKAFIGHGLLNHAISMEAARHAHRVLFATGADVQFRSYMAGERVEPDMLRDVNRWIISNLNAETDRLILRKKKAKRRKKF